MNIDYLLSQMTLEEKAGLCSGRDFWHTKAVERLGIPSVMMCDGPHGLRKQKGEGDHLGINESIQTVCYPSASALASSFDRQILRQIGKALGQECQAENVALLLGPGINIKRSPLCGRNFEYFSEDPYLTGELASAYVSSLQEQGISACVKHFAANNQETRRQSGTSNMDERTLHEIYLPAFEKVVKDGGVNSVMCAYNAVNGTFCAENKVLLTDILRKKWGFTGFVVTDWGAVKDRVRGLLAGLDLEMPGGAGVQDQKIVDAVRSGILDETILDEAVRNILSFLAFYQNNRQSDQIIDREECAHLAEKVAEQCAVLLKNEAVLPISKADSVAFIGAFAEEPRYQGSGSSHINVAHPVSALEASQGLRIAYAPGYHVNGVKDDPELVKHAVALAAKVDTAVVFAGLPNAFESEGADRMTLAMPDNQSRLIEAVAAANPNTVVVLHGGAPMELPWLDQVKGVLCMHLGGQMVGEATVRLLFGDANPCGKLAETWPMRLEDTPCYLNFPGSEGTVEYHETVYVGYRYYDKKKMNVLFPFGHGLSYTSFHYGPLILDREKMLDTQKLTVRCCVENTGAVPGKEIVQLYVSDESSTVGRPQRELKGFETVELLPGERKEVSFELDQRSFAYYEPKIHDWYVESGTFSVELGASSRDIRASAKVEVTGTVELPVHYHANSPLADLLKTETGRTLLKNMMPRSENSENLNHMGEGSDKVAQNMIFEMPLQALVTFGRMSREKLDAILDMLNSD